MICVVEDVFCSDLTLVLFCKNIKENGHLKQGAEQDLQFTLDSQLICSSLFLKHSRVLDETLQHRAVKVFSSLSTVPT